MNNIYKILISIFAIVAALFVSGCQDDLIFPDYDIPEGSSRVTFELGYQDFTPALDTRSSGTALRDIKTLWVLIYRASDGVLLEKTQITDFDSNGQAQRPGEDESTTGSASFKFTYVLPNGLYRIYAVANYDMSDAKIDAFTKENPDLDIKTNENALYHLPLSWDNSNVENNAEMFGWFVNGDQNTPRTIDAQIKSNVPQVTIKGNDTKVHCWLRRAASKVTVAFNTTGLNDDVHLYLKSVAIKDIPATCYLHSYNNLGAKNDNADDYYYASAFAVESSAQDMDIIYFKGATKDHNGKENHSLWPEITSNNYYYGLYSDANGVHNTLINIDITRNPGESEEDFKKRYEAAYQEEYKRRLEDFRAKEHSETVRALYFYENMQGEGVAGTQSDKKQVVDGDKGSNVPSYPNGVYNKTHDENGNLRDDALVLGWKDAKQWGSYIEIKGYYEGATGRGDITYRFMLGKDTHLDYNSERNHHYKLTLVFKGKANDVDFHIDYEDEAKPGLFTPEEVYVPYLYNQPSKVIVRATPPLGYELESLEAIIVKNEWRPMNATSSEYYEAVWNDQISYNGYSNVTHKGRKYDEYNWNRTKWPKDDPECDNNCLFGFLSLYYMYEVAQEPEGIDGLEPANHNDFVPEIIEEVHRFYYKHKYYKSETESNEVSIGKRKYTNFPAKGASDINEPDDFNPGNKDREHQSYYNVKRLDSEGNPTDYICEIPIYTRAKTLDSWLVYSGANQFHRHQRYAKLKFIATYKKIDNPSDKKTDISYTNVYQTERIENPYGIYRRHDNLETFHVNLKKRINLDDNASGNIYEPIVSDGSWTATIEKDPNGLVMLTGNGQVAIGEGQSITGRPNSQIDFTYHPRKTVGENISYGAIIRINYHNNTCIHKIIVRQGYAPTAIVTGGPKYSAFNVYDNNTLTASPLSVGSLFRRGPSLKQTYALAESNNETYKLGVNPTSTSVPFKRAGSTATATWSDFKGRNTSGSIVNVIPTNFYPNAFNDMGNMKSWRKGKNSPVTERYIMPKSSDLTKLGLVDSKSSDGVNNDVNCGFGVVYADGATNTLSTKDAFGFYDPDNNIFSDDKGVRGLITYNLKTGLNMFLPLGKTGHAHRQWSRGMLHYSITMILDKAQAVANCYRPLAYLLKDNCGGAYWLAMRNDITDAGVIDINYANFMFSPNILSEFGVYGTRYSGALPIRPVQQ